MHPGAQSTAVLLEAPPMPLLPVMLPQRPASHDVVVLRLSGKQRASALHNRIFCNA